MKRSYWLCQAIGWGAYVLWTLPTTLKYGTGAVLETFFSAALGIGLTHAYRARARIPGPHRRLLAHVFRILGAGLLLAAIHVAALTVVEVGILGDRESIVLTSVSALVRWTILFTAWVGLYTTATLTRRSLEISEALKSAELRELRAQLNPHFLFNTLNGIRSLIDEDKARARKAVSELAAVLRFTLRVSKEETVELREEVAMVDAYLALESLRLESRLTVSREIAPQASGARVPCMLVFTLVENAVKHGIAPRPEGGTVDIRIDTDDRALAITVANTRGGSNAVSTELGGLGLANLKSRIALMYGENGVLEVDGSLPDRFAVSVRIPREVTG